MPRIVLQQRKKQPQTLNKRVYQHIYGDARWRRIRDAKWKMNPLCELCEKQGLVVLTEHIHHIKPFDKGKTPEEVTQLAFDPDNVQALCSACHHKIHLTLR